LVLLDLKNQFQAQIRMSFLFDWIYRGVSSVLQFLEELTIGGMTFTTFDLGGHVQDETIAGVPVLVLGNKIDRPEAISEGALRGAFGLDGQVTGKVGIC
ncbi:hypothetical protein GOODEAATRI_011038, partial [Goodea atripinnis]